MFGSYLSSRKQRINVNNIASEIVQQFEYGAPQGTVLSPLLFTIYINNLLDLPISESIIAFADDTAVFYEASFWDSLKAVIGEDFKIIKLWFDSKLLTVNWKKTCYVPFTLYKDHLPEYNALTVTLSNGKIA